MTNDYAPPEELDVPPGEYQAVVRASIKTGEDTVVLFELTEPDRVHDKHNPQIGLGGRVARMWLSLDHENPVTQREAEARLSGLLQAAEKPEAKKIEEILGAVVWVRVSRVIMRSDPSRYKSAVIEARSPNYTPPDFVQ